MYRALFLILFVFSFGHATWPSVARSQSPANESRKKITQVKPARKHNKSDTVGVVNGVVITYGDFMSIMSGYLKAFVARSKDNLVSDSLYTVIVDSSWRRAVSDVLIEQEIRKRKLSMTDADVKAALIDNPPDYLRTQFTDSLGVLHKDIVKRALNDPASDSIVSVIVMGERIRLETDRLLASIAEKSHTPNDRDRAFEAWLRKTMAASKIVDRRTTFGFY